MWFFKKMYFRIFALAILLTYLLIEAQGEGDLFIYYCAAVDLDKGIDIYQADYLDGFHYYYSVLFAWFLNLFSPFPFYGIKFSWLLLNVILFFHLFLLLKESKMVRVLSEKQKQFFLFFVLVFSFRFFHQNIHSSQITILILWCCIYGLISIENGKTLKGSSILALGINIKLLPLVLLPYLIYRGYIKAFFFTIVFYVFLLLMPSVFVGHSYNFTLLSSWFSSINPANQQHILDTDERSFHGLSTLLATLFYANPPDPYAMTLKRNIADLPLETLKWIILLGRTALVALTLFFLRWPPFKKAVSVKQNLAELAYILLLIPLIFPHQQHYAFLFIVPAYALILYYLILVYNVISMSEKCITISLMIMIYLSANLSALLGEFNYYYEHFKILTYGTLLVIPLLLRISLNNRKFNLGTSNES